MCSCSVNFCRECLLKITSFSTQRQLTCPACRKSHQNDLSTFVRNRLVERMIEKSQFPTGSNIPMAGSNIQPVPSAPTHVYPELRSNLDFEIIPESEFREMSIQEEGSGLEIRG
jgi:hypothetical protein